LQDSYKVIVNFNKFEEKYDVREIFVTNN